jgi:hypothetical protein
MGHLAFNQKLRNIMNPIMDRAIRALDWPASRVNASVRMLGRRFGTM